MKTIIIVVIGIIIILIGAVAINQGDATLDQAPDFSLKNYSGETVRLTDSAEKIRVINSWASWCPFCITELPDFKTLKKEFGDGIEVIAINRQESLEKAREFGDTLDIADSMVFLLDPNDSFYKSIGGSSMPETIFVDGEGFIHFHKRGVMSLEEMRERVNNIINS